MHEFQRLTVLEVRNDTPDARVITLAVPEPLRDAFRYRPGQHLAFRLLLDGEEMRRTYSICSGPDDRHLRIAIKRVAGGRISNWANECLKPGHTLEAMPPAGRFILPASEGGPRHLAFFAAGAGITPIVSMIKHALAREPETVVTLVYGNRTVDSILFREELEDLKDRHLDRFSLMHVLSCSDVLDVPLLRGRIDGAKVMVIAEKLLRKKVVDHVFLCGPGTLIRDARNALLDLGFPRERIHHEFFAPAGGAYQSKRSPREVSATLTAGASVTALLDGLTHRFTVAPEDRIVDAALKAGIPLPYSCKGGMCCTCRCKLVEGRVVMDVNYSLEPWELEAGYVLACQSRPLTPRVALDFDQT
jgi:ring-1,2-phenylacetyl-CoA epoxidase subunit PaaE